MHTGADTDLIQTMLESIKISQKERFTALTSTLEHGDQKPPKLLRHLEKLGKGRILGGILCSNL